MPIAVVIFLLIPKEPKLGNQPDAFPDLPLQPRTRDVQLSMLQKTPPSKKVTRCSGKRKEKLGFQHKGGESLVVLVVLEVV